MAGQCVVEEVTTQHSICAVVALYKNDQDSASPRVAGPGPTMLALTCAAMAGCVKILAVFSNSIL